MCENRDGWLVAWGLWGCMLIRFPTVWLLPFEISLFCNYNKPSNTQEPKQRPTQQRSSAKSSANPTKSNQTLSRYTHINDTIILYKAKPQAASNQHPHDACIAASVKFYTEKATKARHRQERHSPCNINNGTNKTTDNPTMQPPNSQRTELEAIHLSSDTPRSSRHSFSTNTQRTMHKHRFP